MKVVAENTEPPADATKEEIRLNGYFERIVAVFTEQERDDPMLYEAALTAFVLFAKCCNPMGDPHKLGELAKGIILLQWTRFELHRQQ